MKCQALCNLAEVHLVLGPNKLMEFVAQATASAKNTQDSYLIAKSSIYSHFTLRPISFDYAQI